MLGRTLRQYVITGHLGHGGMGEVWLAHDQTLDRGRRLKVLPARDSDAVARKERFFRKAKAASALNHPSSITIYEINSDQGIDFIAMGLVRGRTLGSLLQQGPLGIDQIVRYATQIAEAVGRAYRAGIVHRDLKPGNIMVTNDDLVKVLDFGIAEVGQRDDTSAEGAATPHGVDQRRRGHRHPGLHVGRSKRSAISSTRGPTPLTLASSSTRCWPGDARSWARRSLTCFAKHISSILQM